MSVEADIKLGQNKTLNLCLTIQYFSRYTLKGLNYMICKRSGWTGEFPSCEGRLDKSIFTGSLSETQSYKENCD